MRSLTAIKAAQRFFGVSAVQLEAMYQEIILDHYRRRTSKGLAGPFDAEVHHVNPTCGDEITLRVALSDDGSVVDDDLVRGSGLFDHPGVG